MNFYADKKQATADKRQEGAPGISSKMRTAAPDVTGIPGAMKAQFETLSGFSFQDVRVHYHSKKPAQLRSLAYTQGNQIYIASGQEKHLEHELGHVVQQKQGRVRPTLTLGNIQLNTNQALEREADTFAFHTRMVQRSQSADSALSSKVVQGKWITDSSGFYQWDKLCGGVIWYSDGNAIWFHIEDIALIEEGDRKRYQMLEHEPHTWMEWNELSSQHHIVFDLMNEISETTRERRFIPYPTDTNLSLDMSIAAYISNPLIQELLTSIQHLPSRADVAYQKLRAILLLHSNADSICQYIEENGILGSVEQLYALFGWMNERLESVEFIPAEVIHEKTDIDTIRYYLLLAYQTLMQAIAGADCDLLAEVALAHDKSVYRTAEHYTPKAVALSLRFAQLDPNVVFESAKENANKGDDVEDWLADIEMKVYETLSKLADEPISPRGYIMKHIISFKRVFGGEIAYQYQFPKAR